ncbi:phosphoglucomutase (alpha-D-glucose-1,6-bisphosphate-dependent) [Shewanella gelidii]|uniref:Phosphoglucomutase n=1 Tax=Shewanella gelidii TaxID=1642821 RepID=A0A917JWI5_9GAMM|nr:phosphoglucomutase (alpha-D-glucose-1,6-bisphosphate-dependent) [Shewanella gelidii]MCL1099056.1 phosphoglucomutase (alpha-D-glucose-1,6-bisphosphate-dependent) [Shewanella gelidii]GGI88510.1 phosphoglucomutase, alpha-D-glucose phosphate-specific [Shewanella gelidii]
MGIHERAGKTAQQQDLVNIPRLMSQYYRLMPDVKIVGQRVSFGTSGHRGNAEQVSFNQHHIWAIAQAVADYRQQAGITGAIYVGIDTHALSQAAFISVLEVLAANQVEVRIDQQQGYTPTPVISRLIIAANENQPQSLCDGLVITPSHNPPQDGGIKYNPPHGGPAESEITAWIEQRANQYLENQLNSVKRVSYTQALDSDWIREQDFISPYVSSLAEVIDMEAIAASKVRIGVDPLGGSGIDYWQPIAQRYGLDITIVNDNVDPSFSFMPLDKDGKIRMDCSSPYAMAGLLAYQNQFDICVGNDPDYDRHGIVCPGFGLMNPNHFLAVAIDYLIRYRPEWSSELAIGKTLVSSAMIDRVVESHQRRLMEVPVGFKWFVDGLASCTVAFGGEESAGAAFLKRDGSTWCTDKDGFILALLAAEIIAITGQTPAQRYQALEEQFGQSYYKRVDSPISLDKKQKFAALDPLSLDLPLLAGESVLDILTRAPGNDAAVGGIKVCTENAWFAARPSGTEALFKIYAESFVSEAHLEKVIQEAQVFIDKALSN